jgi:general secretion pathway protein D
VARSAIIDLFQSALRSNNAALVNTNGMYRIVAADQAVIGASMRTEDTPDSEQVGSGLQVVQLRYVSASEIRRVLDTIAPRGGIVRTDDARNLITLSANRQDIATMMDAIALFDIDTMKGTSFALVPVKTSEPDAIAGELKTVFAADREGPMAGMVASWFETHCVAVLLTTRVHTSSPRNGFVVIAGGASPTGRANARPMTRSAMGLEG